MGADLIHCHYATGYGLLGKLSGFKRRIVSLYGADVFDFPNKSVFHRKLLQYILSGADETLSTSQIMAAEYNNIYPSHRSPTVTPFGVDLEKFTPLGEAEEKRTSLNIGIVKKLERKYGIDVLLDAMSILVGTHPQENWVLNVVGEGSQLEALNDQVKELGLQSNVNFLGAIENSQVPKFLVRQDVFVVPSREESESFGVAAVEAQACGLPVIASNVGGLPEVVSDNKTGLIVPKEDDLALAQAIENICMHSDLRSKLSIGARERVVRKYNWSKNLDQMIEIYTRNLEK